MNRTVGINLHIVELQTVFFKKRNIRFVFLITRYLGDSSLKYRVGRMAYQVQLSLKENKIIKGHFYS